MVTNKRRVLVILPLIGHPRHSKRILMLQQEGFEVEVAAFERPYHNGRVPSCPVTVLGSIKHGQYLKRAVKMFIALSKIRAMIRNSDMVYAFGLDLSVLSIIAGVLYSKPLIIEIGDIRKAQTSTGINGFFVRCIDRIVTRSASLLVVTAQGFATEYYGKMLNIFPPYMVIENKVETGMRQARGVPRAQSRPSLRIGYFGQLRCTRSWETIERLATMRPDMQFIIAGSVLNPSDLLSRIKKLQNVTWMGEYRSPADLPNLYGQVDLIWASPFPEANEHNWKWARSNRFYEACHFKVPPIVFIDSGDGKAVREYSIGLEVGGSDINHDIDVLSKITFEVVSKWRAKIEVLDPNIYTYTNEASQLRDTLNKLI